MIYTFPTPYPDELLYSVLARYHVRSGNTSPKMTTEDLFGKRTVRSVWDLPANLNALLDNTGSYWSAEELIFNYTMYPYYAAFLLPNQAKKVKQSMMDNKGETIHTRIGIAASNVKLKEKLWVCNECIEEDMKTYGETYWRRVHQCPSVYFCPKHETILEETEVSARSFNQHEYIIASPELKRKKANLKEMKKEETQTLIEIAKASYMLLTNKYHQTMDNTLRKKYIETLKQNNYATPNGTVKREKLYRSFKAKFSEQLLELLQSSIEFEETNWLTMIFQKHRKAFHPLRHLLVILFFDTDLDHLFDKKEYHPFGKGPWLCLNPACSNFQQAVVKNLKITIDYDTRKPVGTFQCDCGFVYSRKGPDKDKNDKFHIGRIKEYGTVWKAKLSELVSEGKTLTEISKDLHSDRTTIKKYAAKLELNVPWKSPKIEQKNNEKPLVDFDKELTERKDQWIQLQKEYPEKSKTELRKIAPDVYTFLYRHDRNWLTEFSPTKKKPQPHKPRINWEKRDEEIVQALKKVLQTWDTDDDKPIRITCTSLGTKINKLSLLQSYGEKLPITMKFISEVSEDIVTFQKRRVEFWIQKLNEESEPITEWKVYKKAGLRPTISNEVKRFISLKVNEYETITKNIK